MCNSSFLKVNLSSPLEQSHSTTAFVDKHGEDTYILKPLKQKLFVDGLSFLLQEIYGIENKNAQKHDDDSQNAECVVCLSEMRDTIILPCRHLCLCKSHPPPEDPLLERSISSNVPFLICINHSHASRQLLRRLTEVPGSALPNLSLTVSCSPPDSSRLQNPSATGRLPRNPTRRKSNTVLISFFRKSCQFEKEMKSFSNFCCRCP